MRNSGLEFLLALAIPASIAVGAFAVFKSVLDSNNYEPYPEFLMLPTGLMGSCEEIKSIIDESCEKTLQDSKNMVHNIDICNGKMEITHDDVYDIDDDEIEIIEDKI